MIGCTNLILRTATVDSSRPTNISQNLHYAGNHGPVIVWSVTKKCNLACSHCYIAVSYTHLRAHETDSSLFVGQRQMCIRDSNQYKSKPPLCWEPRTGHRMERYEKVQPRLLALLYCCLLYTSPSPRDGLLSIRRAASDVYKRQQPI